MLGQTLIICSSSPPLRYVAYSTLRWITNEILGSVVVLAGRIGLDSGKKMSRMFIKISKTVYDQSIAQIMT